MKKIGFNLGLSKGGPSNFIGRLKISLKGQKLLKTSFFFDPTIDFFLCTNQSFINLWNKNLIFRVDGVPYKKFLVTKKLHNQNKKYNIHLNKSKGIIFQSIFSKKIYYKFFSIEKRIPNKVIYNGVNLKRFSQNGANLRKKLGINKNDIVFIASANYRNKNKRLNLLIECFNKFKYGNKKIFLIILGKINENLNIKKIKNNNIIFTGKIDSDKLAYWYRTGDVLLHFTYIDWCPNSVIEAIACGLPVLTTNLGGAKELINITNCGLVVKADLQKKLSSIEPNSPPKANINKILQGMKKILKNKNKILQKRDLKKIDIDYVSREYTSFIKKISKNK